MDAEKWHSSMLLLAERCDAARPPRRGPAGPVKRR